MSTQNDIQDKYWFQLFFYFYFITEVSFRERQKQDIAIDNTKQVPERCLELANFHKIFRDT